MTASGDRTARIWGFTAETLPPDDLLGFIQLATGQWVDDNGGLVQLPPAKLYELWDVVRAKYPHEFNVGPDAAQDWHRRQANQAERDEDWFAVRFHARLLLAQAPADETALRQLATAERRLNPRELAPPPRATK